MAPGIIYRIWRALQQDWRTPTAGLYLSLAALLLTVALLAAGGISAYKFWQMFDLLYGLSSQSLELLKFLCLFLLLGGFGFGIWRVVAFTHRSKQLSQNEILAWLAPRRRLRALLSAGSESLVIIAPYFAGFVLVVTGVTVESSVSPEQLRDGMFLNWDYHLFGQPFFALLHTVAYPDWFSALVVWCYEGLALLIALSAAFLMFVNRKLLRRYATAFLISSVVLLVFWHALPALDPQIRYVDNIYQLPVPAATAEVIQSIVFPKAVVDFFSLLRSNTNSSTPWPVSTFPSAHITWIVLIGYYVFMARGWLRYLVTGPLVFSAFGTVFIAQHYFADLPAGLAVAIVSIWLVRYFDPAATTKQAMAAVKN